MSDTVQCWTNHEREFRIDDIEVYKRSFRPAEYKMTKWNKPYVPPLGLERLANEAACLRFIRERTNIPVPDVLQACEDNSSFVLVARRPPGVEMHDLSPEDQAIAMKEVQGFVEVLQQLRSDRLGGPTGLICPPQRGTQYFPVDQKWSAPSPSAEPDLVFCHCDLSQSNIIVNPESLKVEGVIDWEYGGFWHEFFETPFFRDPRASGRQFKDDSENAPLRDFLCEMTRIFLVAHD